MDTKALWRQIDTWEQEETSLYCMMPLWARVSKKVDEGEYYMIDGLVVDLFLSLRKYLFSEVRVHVMFALQMMYQLLQHDGNRSLFFPLVSYQILARLQELFHIPLWGPHTMLSLTGEPLQVDIFGLVKQKQEQQKQQQAEDKENSNNNNNNNNNCFPKYASRNNVDQDIREASFSLFYYLVATSDLHHLYDDNQEVEGPLELASQLPNIILSLYDILTANKNPLQEESTGPLSEGNYILCAKLIVYLAYNNNHENNNLCEEQLNSLHLDLIHRSCWDKHVSLLLMEIERKRYEENLEEEESVSGLDLLFMNED
jgi:hypothetical protein